MREREWLLGLNNHEAESLTAQQKYQRIRYLREIEATAWVQELRRKLPVNDLPKNKSNVVHWNSN
jgi:hypothetical protein